MKNTNRNNLLKNNLTSKNTEKKFGNISYILFLKTNNNNRNQNFNIL